PRPFVQLGGAPLLQPDRWLDHAVKLLSGQLRVRGSLGQGFTGPPGGRIPSLGTSAALAPGVGTGPESAAPGDCPPLGQGPAERGDPWRQHQREGPGIVPPRFWVLRLHPRNEGRGLYDRSRGGFPGQPEEGTLRVLRKRACALAAVARYPSA